MIYTYVVVYRYVLKMEMYFPLYVFRWAFLLFFFLLPMQLKADAELLS